MQINEIVKKEAISATIRLMKVGETYTRPLKTIESTRALVLRIKDEFPERAYSVTKKRENLTCVIKRTA